MLFFQIQNRQLQEEEMERLEMIQENGHLRQSIARLSYQEKSDMMLVRHGDKGDCRSRMLPCTPIQSSSLRLLNDSSAEGSMQVNVTFLVVEIKIGRFIFYFLFIFFGNRLIKIRRQASRLLSTNSS